MANRRFGKVTSENLPYYLAQVRETNDNKKKSNLCLEILDYFFGQELVPLKEYWSITDLFLGMLGSGRIILDEKVDKSYLRDRAVALAAMESGQKFSDPDLLSDPVVADRYIEHYKTDLPDQVSNEVYLTTISHTPPTISFNDTTIWDLSSPEYEFIPSIRTPLITLSSIGIINNRIREILTTAPNNIYSSCVIYYAYNGIKITDSYDHLSIKVGKYGTVAHLLASRLVIFSENKVLLLKDPKGNTVAHVLASKGYKFTDPFILDQRNNRGKTVRSVSEKSKLEAIKSIFAQM